MLKKSQGPGAGVQGPVDAGSKFDITDLLGKEFKYGGRGPEAYDCYGLCIEVYRRRGKALPDFGSSPSASWQHRMIDEGKKLFIELKHPAPFCLVTFMLRPPYTTHIGVVLEDCCRFIHIQQKLQVVIERLDGQLWKNRITGYYLLGEGVEAVKT